MQGGSALSLLSGVPASLGSGGLWTSGGERGTVGWMLLYLQRSCVITMGGSRKERSIECMLTCAGFCLMETLVAEGFARLLEIELARRGVDVLAGNGKVRTPIMKGTEPNRMHACLLAEDGACSKGRKRQDRTALLPGVLLARSAGRLHYSPGYYLSAGRTGRSGTRFFADPGFDGGDEPIGCTLLCSPGV